MTRSKQGATLVTIGLLVFLGGVYTNAALTYEEVVVPGIFALFGIVLILLARPGYAAGGQIHFFVLLLVFLLASTLLGDERFLFERFGSFVQMAAALVALHVALAAMEGSVRETLAKIFGWLIAFIVVGCAAESLLPFVRDVSDAFREWAFTGRFIYAFEQRDLQTYGVIRPNWFTQEPSHPAKAFVAFGAAWYLLSSNPKRVWLLLGATAALLFFLRSPIVLLAVPLALGLETMKQGPSRIVVAVIALAPVLAILAVVGAELFEARIELIQRGEDFSFFGRLIGPYQVAYLALRDYPWFGVGLGGKESLEAYFIEAFHAWGSTRYLSSIYQTSLANAAANSVAFFGLIGTPIFYGLLAAYFRQTIVPLAIVLLFFQIDGALEGVRMWGYIAVVVGAYAKVSLQPQPRRKPKRERRLAVA